MPNKFGKRLVGTSFSKIALGGIVNFLTAATTIEAISGDANDTLLGTGARKILVIGNDAAGDVISETLDMNGTSATTASTLSFLRVVRVYVSEVGTYDGGNFDDIDIRVSGAGANIIRIGGVGSTGAATYGFSQTQSTHLVVPRNAIALVKNIKVNVDGTKSCNIIMCQRQRLDESSTNMAARRVVWELSAFSGSANFDFNSEVSFDGLTDVWFEGLVGTGTTTIDISYDVLILFRQRTGNL